MNIDVTDILYCSNVTSYLRQHRDVINVIRRGGREYQSYYTL